MIIFEFESNSSEKVRISLEEFKNKKLIHIRTYENYGDGKGFQPTWKGVTINISKASELRKGIDRLFAKAEFEKNE